jgi:hypothetical protein
MKKWITLTLFFFFVGLQNTSGQAKKKEVYRTQKGEKYHKKDCRIIKDKAAFKVTLKEAKKKGLQACKVCKPLAKETVIQEKKSVNRTKIKAKKKVATRCTGTTQKGTRCKRMTKNADGTCWQH